MAKMKNVRWRRCPQLPCSVSWKTLAVPLVSLFMLSICIHVHFTVVYEAQMRQLPPGNELEIRLSQKALDKEGLGAVLSGLKPVLLLKNRTGAVITYRRRGSGHGYNINTFVYFDPYVRSRRVHCKLTKPMNFIFSKITERCQDFNFEELSQYGVFNRCNTVTVHQYLNHPRTCLKYTEDLVRNISRFQLDEDTPKEDVCVLRRGGDVEKVILRGEGNMWAIDEEKTLPVLAEVSKRTRRIVLVTETRLWGLKKKYHADVFSNRQSLDKVARHLAGCRCLFVGSASSFAAVMVQVTRPMYIIYTESREGFKYDVEPYAFQEYSNAYSVLSGTENLTNLCAPQS